MVPVGDDPGAKIDIPIGAGWAMDDEGPVEPVGVFWLSVWLNIDPWGMEP